MDEKLVGYREETENKPPVLYHGSIDRNIQEFKPEMGKYLQRVEEPGIFATPSKEVALAFARPKVCPAAVGSYNGGKTWHIVISDKEKFLESDHGGAIYYLPPETFVLNPESKLAGGNEYISRKEVRPIKKEEYESSLEAMIKAGIEVYFVDRDTFDKFKKAKNGRLILEQLESENQKRGLTIENVR